MDIFVTTAVVVIAYLLGSIPTGYLVGRARGIDVRTVGSGNIGATNAFRVLGKTAGSFVLFADALKGYLAAKLVPDLVYQFLRHSSSLDPAMRERLCITAGVVVILGHNYTCWLKFKGGKGIATTAGVLIGLMPFTFGVALATWIIVTFSTRYVSVGSIAAALVLPFATWLHGDSASLIIIASVMGALAIYKHKGNVERLLNGTENKIGGHKSPPAAGGVS